MSLLLGLAVSKRQRQIQCRSKPDIEQKQLGFFGRSVLCLPGHAHEEHAEANENQNVLYPVQNNMERLARRSVSSRMGAPPSSD